MGRLPGGDNAVSATFLESPRKSSVILGICQPLLDISVEVDISLLEKYGLEMGGCVMAEEKHDPLFEELAQQPNVQYIVGGATQNSIRVAQWMLQSPGATAFMGCIGADDRGAKMKNACEKDGVKTAYMVDEEAETGCCGVLVCNAERSMCTSLKASCNFKHDHILLPENLQVLRDARIVYSAGFFITTSPETMRIAARTMVETGGVYCVNLGAPFLMHVPQYKSVFVELMPSTDILFGNESEALAWAESEGWETTDIAFIAMRLSLIPSTKARKRTVVITQGASETIVCINGHVTRHPVVWVDKIVDTNGAGDAYVGGYLAALSKDLPVEACCRAGAHSASVIVQRAGCTYPARPDYALCNWNAVARCGS